MLANAKHEHFAHLVAKGADVAEACVTAGYSENGARQAASRLLKNVDIAARIVELRNNVAAVAIEKTGVDRAWVIDQLVENIKMAKEGEKPELSAANRALELLGKEIGMFIDRKEIRTGKLDGLEHDDLKALNDALSQLVVGTGATLTSGTSSTCH